MNRKLPLVIAIESLLIIVSCILAKDIGEILAIDLLLTSIVLVVAGLVYLFKKQTFTNYFS